MFYFALIRVPFQLAPAFTSDPIIMADTIEGIAYKATIADDANDPENDPLTFWKVSGPAWLKVAANGHLSGTPSASDVGLNSFTVEVSDDKGNIDRATLEIEVYSASAPSTVSLVSPTSRLAYATFDKDTSDSDDNLTMVLVCNAERTVLTTGVHEK